MHAKIMHHCVLLIITFLSCTLCIQNVKSVPNSNDKLERKNNYSPEARQSTFHQTEYDNTGFIPTNGVGFQFPNDNNHQYETNNPNELPSFGSRNPYTNTNQIANNNQGANPYNLDLNTGEHSTNANNHNNYPYQQHPNAIANFGHRDSSNVPNANDFYLSQEATSSPYQQQFNYKNPNYPPQRHQPYVQRPTYAQSYENYLFNGGQANYNRRPTPPRPVPSLPRPPAASSYSPYQDGHFTPPYRNDLTPPSSLSSLSSLLTGTATYPSQYANQFGNFALPFGGGGGGGISSGVGGASANPLGSLLNSFGVPFAGENPLSMQIIRGLENIARNDDLQCVPKVLCQMLGSPTRRAQLPAFITSPVITRFIASLPSSSPALIFGRAALLGLSGGEYSCARTYSKCPQNEDDILYYLNNHRGGFFKFFSEPDSQPVADTQHQYSPPSQSTPSQPQSELSILNFLTGLGSSSSSPTAITNTNQGNLNSFMSSAVTNGIGSLFGNIISGFLSGQTATRRTDDDVTDDSHSEEDDSHSTDESNSTEDPSSDKVEGRILNNKSNILAFVEPHSNPISFPLGATNDNYETQQFESEFRFPSTPHRDVDVVADTSSSNSDDNRTGKRVNFIDSDSNARPSYGTRMVFPDRTGTGNLRFDNDEYFRVGKIINRPEYNRGYTKPESYTTTRRTPVYKDYRKTLYTSNSVSNDILNRYASSNYRQDYNQANKEDTTGNIYVTNGQGIIEYYINAQGRKVYV